MHTSNQQKNHRILKWISHGIVANDVLLIKGTTVGHKHQHVYTRDLWEKRLMVHALVHCSVCTFYSNEVIHQRKVMDDNYNTTIW